MISIEQIHVYLRRAASRPFAPELMQPLCIFIGAGLLAFIVVAGRA